MRTLLLAVVILSACATGPDPVEIPEATWDCSAVIECRDATAMDEVGTHTRCAWNCATYEGQRGLVVADLEPVCAPPDRYSTKPFVCVPVTCQATVSVTPGC